nr:metalloprotease TldD [Candidatus Profftella armatura (Diaphorina cf. continua)]
MNIIEKNINPLHIARNILLEPFDLDEKILLKMLGNMFKNKVDYADFYFQFTKNENWILEEGIVKTGNFSINQGVGIRAVSGDKIAFSYSDEISKNTLINAVKSTRAIANQGNGKIKIINNIKKIKTHSLYESINPISSINIREKIKLLEDVERIARLKDPRVIKVIANLSGEYDVILITRNDGLIVADIRPLVQLFVTIIVEQNGRKEIGNSGCGGRYNYNYFTDIILEKCVSNSVNSALINLEAKPAPAGIMKVVLGPGWPGILLHEAIGHGLEGDFNRKGSSTFSNCIGKCIASKEITVVDDGTIANRRGSINIDDEGTPTQCTTLIENGILKGYMQDIMNARLMNMSITGNARRESFAHMPIPRMTNTYMLNGKFHPEEIITSVENGLYATNFSGGQVDITNGKFVFSASEAYIIKNGKITYPIKGATLIGNGPNILKKVSMIGNDMKLDPGIGVCGKYGQIVPVGVGQPTLKIDSMTVGGTN